LAGKLGEGQGNPVMKCTHKESGIEYAVKQIRNNASALAELKTHMLCDDHPLVVTVVEVFQQTAPPSPPKPQPAHRRFGFGQSRRTAGGGESDSSWLVVVLELCAGGDLFDRLTAAPGGHFTEAVAKMYTYQLASILAHCHSKGVVHRDIKPENIAFANDGHEIRLIDFGFATNETPQQGKYTAAYIAPEILKSMAAKRRTGKWSQYTDAVDMWSLGATLYTLLSGFSPFFSTKRRRPSEIPPDMREMIYRASMSFPKSEWAHCSDGAIQLVRKLLDPVVKTRLTAKQLLEHSWTAAGATDVVIKAITRNTPQTTTATAATADAAADAADAADAGMGTDTSGAAVVTAAVAASSVGPSADAATGAGDDSASSVHTTAHWEAGAPAVVTTTATARSSTAAATTTALATPTLATTMLAGRAAAFTIATASPAPQTAAATAMDTMLDDQTPELHRLLPQHATSSADMLLEDHVQRRLLLSPEPEVAQATFPASAPAPSTAATLMVAAATAVRRRAATSAAAYFAGIPDAFGVTSGTLAIASQDTAAAAAAPAATAAAAAAATPPPAITIATADTASMDASFDEQHDFLHTGLNRSLNRSEVSSPFRSDSDKPSENTFESYG